jgi:hypothetical protein
VTVDNVRLRPAGGGSERYWRDDVSTLVGDTARRRAGGFCLNWVNRYDTWTAGDCPDLLSVPPEPPEPPSGDAEVVGDVQAAQPGALSLLGGLSFIPPRSWSCGWHKCGRNRHKGNHNSKIAVNLGGYMPPGLA